MASHPVSMLLWSFPTVRAALLFALQIMRRKRSFSMEQPLNSRRRHQPPTARRRSLEAGRSTDAAVAPVIVFTGGSSAKPAHDTH